MPGKAYMIFIVSEIVAWVLYLSMILIARSMWIPREINGKD